MAFVTVIPRNDRTAGVHRSTSRTVPPGTHRVTLRLNATWAEGDDVALFGIEESADGGVTWRHRTSAAIYGGARARDGSLPYLSIMQPDAALQYRAFVVLGKSLNLGLEIEMI